MEDGKADDAGIGVDVGAGDEDRSDEAIGVDEGTSDDEGRNGVEAAEVERVDELETCTEDDG